MDSLTHLLRKVTTSDAAHQAEAIYRRNMATEGTSLRTLPPPSPEEGTASLLNGPYRHLLTSTAEKTDPAKLRAMMLQAMQESKPRFPPPQRLPCANVNVEREVICSKKGTLVCSSCRLVSYCSKSCQKTHWHVHKTDCKADIRSREWKPQWIVEGRPPSFIDGPTRTNPFDDPHGIGMSLWGNMPAVDVISSQKTERDLFKNYSLAFVASGDMRHIVYTVNRLPDTYQGKLKIMFNDLNPLICLRNVILLLILAEVQDNILAADIALHFWYSLYMPMEYRLSILSLVHSHFSQLSGSSDQTFSTQLGTRAELTGEFTPEMLMWCLSFTSQSLSPAQAQNEYERVRFSPRRKDFRDRMYSKLKPSHRLAFLEYRRFGLVLPFGAVNAHFNMPNSTLFSPNGQWLQTDYADPLDGWNLEEVVRAGREHGAQLEDIYGCLYFYLTDELQLLARRLQSWNITFHALNRDATTIARDVQSGRLSSMGLPSSTKFDRIEVSNILDKQYVGFSDVLAHWVPLLADCEFSTMIGYFMNWAFDREEATVNGLGRGGVQKLMKQLQVMGKLKPPTQVPNFDDIQLTLYSTMHHMQVVFDTWPSFFKYMQENGLRSVSNKTKLRLCERHILVPHRIGAPVDGAPDSLPMLDDDENWYLQVDLANISFLERYVEFRRSE